MPESADPSPATNAPERVFLSPLQETVATTPTDLWNDSCSVDSLTYALEHGATGATTNPTIVGEVLATEKAVWHDRIVDIVSANPVWTEDEVAWKLIEEMAIRGADLLLPVFEREHGVKGRLSIQTSPKLYRDAIRLVEQSLHFAELAPNIQVKIPATRAGIEAVEHVTATGTSINATVCFTVSQALAVAEAVQRGVARFEGSGGDASMMSPVCTIMVGRLDDWLDVVAGRDGLAVTPGVVSWSGLACFKRAYSVYQERGYRTRLLAAAYRHHRHWSELVGGDIVLTIPPKWQRIFNASSIKPAVRIDRPVPGDVVSELARLFPDFRRAYEIDGLQLDEFDQFGPTVRTLRQFLSSYTELTSAVRDVMLPNPDLG